jgi:spore coat protein U-like protein
MSFAAAMAFAVSLFELVPASVLAAPMCNTANRPIEVSATNLAFGIYSPGSPSPTDSNSTVNVSCANANDRLPSFTVSLSGGGAGSFNPRKMSFGTALLSYNMYTTSAYTNIWGDGTSGTSTQSYNANQNQNQISFTDYGQVPSTQFVTAGNYTDSITVTVTY